jgi:hypothetical protein
MTVPQSWPVLKREKSLASTRGCAVTVFNELRRYIKNKYD